MKHLKRWLRRVYYFVRLLPDSSLGIPSGLGVGLPWAVAVYWTTDEEDDDAPGDDTLPPPF